MGFIRSAGATLQFLAQTQDAKPLTHCGRMGGRSGRLMRFVSPLDLAYLANACPIQMIFPLNRHYNVSPLFIMPTKIHSTSVVKGPLPPTFKSILWAVGFQTIMGTNGEFLVGEFTNEFPVLLVPKVT